MPDQQTLATARIVHQPYILQARMLRLLDPLLSEAEAARLAAGSTAQVGDTDGKRWTTLAGWLEAEPADDAVLCRKTGLQIELRAAEAVGEAALLPFREGSPAAELVWRDGGGEQHRPLQALIDPRRRTLELVLPFAEPGAAPEARAAGLELYGEVVAAMSSPDGVEVRLGWTQAYRVQVPAQTDRPEVTVRDHRHDAVVVRDHRTERPRPATPGDVAVNPNVLRRSDTFRVERASRAAIDPAVLRAAPAAPPPAAAPAAAINPGAMAVARPVQVTAVKRADVMRVDHRYTVPPARTTPTERAATVAGARTIRVRRPLDHPSTYPDELRARDRGWGQLAGPSGTLHYRDTDRADTFLYLPTRFQLGYYVEPDGATGRPPMRPEFYLAGDDDYRVRVTLVAVPSIDDADREALRRHLRDTVLLGKLPFVRLAPAGGLVSDFLPTFTTSSGGEQQTLPASIGFRALEVDLDDRILLEFDMPAGQYAIFTELLRKGLHGTARIADAVQESIPVRLSLDDVGAVGRLLAGPPGDGAAPGVFVWLEGTEPEPEAAAAAMAMDFTASAAAPELRLVVANRLDHPVRLASLGAALLDSGPVAGMIFDAEEVDLVAGGTELAARGDQGGSDRVAVPLVPRRIAVWDETVPLPGRMRVDGGSPQEWLDRVHQDPSLAPAELGLRLERVAVTGEEAVELVRVALYERGADTPRQRLELGASDRSRAWPVRLTLDELAGRLPALELEYDCVTADGGISLPQRVRLELPGATAVQLRPVVETPDSVYTVEAAGGERTEGLSREEAARRIEALRAAGEGWRVFARRRAQEPTGTGGAGTGTGDGGTGAGDAGPGTGGTGDAGGTGGTGGAGGTGEPAAAPVTIVADLLAAPFAAGELASVFVTLQPAGDGPQTTLAFEPDHPATRTWTPPGPGTPPFRYRVTYLFTGDRPPRRVEGTEAGPVLVLDPEG